MNAFVAWFDAQDMRTQWLLVCSAVLVLIGSGVFGMVVSALSTWRRERREKKAPLPPFMVPGAVVSSSPFAPKQRQVSE